jgi:hypothetical protein
MIFREDNEIWLVYEGGDLLCVVDSESKAEDICVMHEFLYWRRFVAPTEGEHLTPSEE